MAAGPVDPIAAGYGRFLASDADRERVIDALKLAFVEGRLTSDELDLRAARTLASRTYAELAAATAGVPAGGRPGPGPARARRRRPPGKRQRARWEYSPLENQAAITWGIAVGTIILPALIAAALFTHSQDLFSASVVALLAYCLAWLVALANRVATRR